MKKPAKFYIPFLHRILGLIIGIMPDDIKRIVFTSSLCRVLSRASTVDEGALAKLNAKMSLASNVSAMMLPALCAGVIWHDVKDELQEMIITCENDPKTNMIACKIRERTSPWLLYDEYSNMENDVKQVLLVAGA